MTSTGKPQLLIYNDGAVRIDHKVWQGGPPHVIEEAVFIPVTRGRIWTDVSETTGPADDIVRRIFVRRVETRRYVVYEEQP